MFGDSSSFPSSSNHDNEMHDGMKEFIKRADKARREGNDLSALHLYLIAFEQADVDKNAPDDAAVDALNKAWDLAYMLKERSLAEHIFEKLEPFLSGSDIAEHADALQQLALDKLEEFGLSRDDLQDMAEMVSDDLSASSGLFKLSQGTMAAGPFLPTRASSEKKNDTFKTEDSAEQEKDDSLGKNELSFPKKEDSLPDKKTARKHGSLDAERYGFSDLVGYGRAIADLKKRGIGVSHDPEYLEFLNMLSKRHGIDRIASSETHLFRSYAREDASHLMAAMVGELDLPTVRMKVEENQHGLPVLCVMASSEFKSRSHFMRTGFGGPGVLMLENIDTWGEPLSGMSDVLDSSTFGQLSRGAREAIMLIRSSVEDPDVTVVASCSTDRNLEEFFTLLLEPLSIIDVDVPNAQERNEVWNHAASLYPSLRFLNMMELVRFSAHMSRYDIYMAAREAVEEAFRGSMESHTYVSVTRMNILEKIAAYQPLDSAEYKQLEDAVVEGLQDQLDGYDDLLKESGR